MKPTTKPAKDDVARRRAGWSIAIAFFSVILSGFQSLTSWFTLQDSRSAGIKLEAGKPSGTYGSFEVQITVNNLANYMIRDANVKIGFELMAPDRVGQIYTRLGERKETIQPQDSEVSILHLTIPQYQITAWERGDLVLVAAVDVVWFNRGSWFSSNTRRCWAYTVHSQFACEDLIENPSGARSLVQRINLAHPSTGPQVINH